MLLLMLSLLTKDSIFPLSCSLSMYKLIHEHYAMQWQIYGSFIKTPLQTCVRYIQLISGSVGDDALLADPDQRFSLSAKINETQRRALVSP